MSPLAYLSLPSWNLNVLMQQSAPPHQGIDGLAAAYFGATPVATSNSPFRQQVVQIGAQPVEYRMQKGGRSACASWKFRTFADSDRSSELLDDMPDQFFRYRFAPNSANAAHTLGKGHPR
jgi:hypothetical protein